MIYNIVRSQMTLINKITRVILLFFVKIVIKLYFICDEITDIFAVVFIFNKLILCKTTNKCIVRKYDDSDDKFGETIKYLYEFQFHSLK